MKKYTVAIVGATGAVGSEMLKILEERNFPVERIKPLGIGHRIGEEILFNDKKIKIEELKASAFEGTDFTLFAAGGDVSKEFAPIAKQEGSIVVDNSSYWRMNDEVPLVVPEVNPEALKYHQGIIANPNCTTIIAMVAIKPLHDYAGVKRIIVSTYQAVSGAGTGGIKELEIQTGQVLDRKKITPKVFSHPIAFNLIPHIDSFECNDYTREEMKMFNEGRKILGIPDLKVNCTSVRVPVFRSHSESITIETERPITPADARELLRKAPGIKLVDSPANLQYPMPLDSSDQDLVYVGRIRKDISSDDDRSLTFWVCGDQIRKGAATNAVQIMEKLIEMGLC